MYSYIIIVYLEFCFQLSCAVYISDTPYTIQTGSLPHPLQLYLGQSECSRAALLAPLGGCV